MRFHFSLLVLGLTFASAVRAQEKVVITDPEISFSYQIPKNWTYNDDGFQHLAFPKSSPESARISITYFEQSYPPLKDIYDGFVKIELPSTRPNFQLIDQGKTSIDEVEAFWVYYTFTDEFDPSIIKEGIHYLYFKIDQVYYLSFDAPTSNFQKFEKAAKKSILSFSASKI